MEEKECRAGEFVRTPSDRPTFLSDTNSSIQLMRGQRGAWVKHVAILTFDTQYKTTADEMKDLITSGSASQRDVNSPG